MIVINGEIKHDKPTLQGQEVNENKSRKMKIRQ